MATAFWFDRTGKTAQSRKTGAGATIQQQVRWNSS